MQNIISHLEKEAQLFAQGIKCLSLFFIDEVAKYRQYDADGMEALGEYGRVFEDEYNSVVNGYRTLFDPSYLAYLDGIDTHETHRGYFSIDKKTGRAVDSKLKRGSEFSDDISAYDLILKNKERLLSFEEPTRFIFSHSALRKGWDNPNVFQICTLKHGGDSSTQKRQEVGRGLRLCVNQAGDRMDAETVGDPVQVLRHAEVSQVRYDLVGKIAEGTVLTRRTVAAILKGIRPRTFNMFRNNPEEFISKVIRLIREQKATMIVEHITYDTIEGSYDSSIFTAEKNGRTFDQAFRATKAIQEYVFTDGTAEESVERKFVKQLDGSEDVNLYAKLPKGFAIPTPVGHYSPDWAIVFHEGAVRHIYFVAETKGTMDSLNLRPIEKAKIDCAKKLFASLSSGVVRYDHVDSFQQLMNKVMR